MNFNIIEKSSLHNKKTICLNMIVKNESNVIIETLKNLLDYINFDYWVISDTGSTDNTQQIIKDFFYDKCIPGEIFNDEWRDFGYNRSKALEHAYSKTDYLLVFDADDRIEGKFVLPFSNTSDTAHDNHNHNHTQIFLDAYMLKIGKGFEYVRPLLINNKKKWEFKGVLHEYLLNLEPVSSYGKIEGDYHIVSGRSGNRSTNPTKYYDDAIILENAYEKELLLPDQGLSGRYAFYCARSYKDAGTPYWDKSIQWYKKLLERETHWNQEKYYAALEIGIMYKDQNDMENALKYLLKTIEYDSERIEGVVIAIEYLYHSNQFLLINALHHKFKFYDNNNPALNDKLFINKYFYNDRIEFFNAITAYKVNDAITGYDCCKRVLINNKNGSNEINVVINNLYTIKQYRELLENDNEKNIIELFHALDTILYQINEIIHNENSNKLWNLLFNKIKTTFIKFNTQKFNTQKFNTQNFNTLLHQKEKNPAENKQHQTLPKETIIITFTTCKRFDLFTQTVNSILNTWDDLYKIDYWFCVDDNSSIEEREGMKKCYDWIEYYMKTPEEKGHRNSMNIIWEKLKLLKPTYWIHIEDDFLFYYSTTYITKGIHVLKYNNQNIHQVVFNKNYAETIDYYKSKGHLPMNDMTDIVLHNHLPNKDNADYPNSHYWPHYSFRPSITRVDTILKLGNYDSSNQFFERDYADKWNAAGFKTAFFDRITHLHIGRLTTEIGDNTKRNAYDLNNESQFTTIKTDMNRESNIKIVNLERREDRKTNTINVFKDACITDFTFFKAIDGKELISTNELKRIFNGNDFGNRRGVIGCAMSHLTLWRDLIEDKQYNYYIIFEDDLTIPDIKNFKERIDKLKINKEFEKNEMIFLGYTMFENKRKQVSHIYDNLNEIGINEIGIIDSKVEQLNHELYIGGTFAYSINKVGAQKMIDYISTNGIKHGIDYVMKIVPDLNRYELQPLIVMSEWNEDASKQIDSDIQTNYDSLDFSHTIEDNFDFIPYKDQIGNDMFFKQPSASASTHIEEMKIALNDEKCAGFNTLGFFKNKIELTQLQQSMYFKHTDGLYVKKNYIESHKNIRIKMICNWCSSEQLCKEWSNMCHDKFHKKWNTIEITHEDKEIDYYVIINSPPVGAVYEPAKTIVFQMEPWVYDETKQWGVKTWGNEWSSPDPTKFLRVFTHKTNLNNVQWQIDYPFHSTPVPEGSKKLNRVATICSEKNFDNGHLLRNNFIRYVDFSETDGVDANEVDIYGRENYHQFSNYKGPVPEDNKYNVYANYKYCLGVENNSEHNYATEKLWEAILCESLCFYWGCPNVEEYIDEKAFVRLPLEDPAAALQLMQQAIREDWWSQRIEIIKQTKEKILNELGFFPLLNKIIIT